MNIKIFSILLVVILPVVFTGILDELTFIITALAFLAGAMAIILQKEAMEKQEIIGAWQLLTTKACGNSGKKEAIEFLASKGVPLSGIDLSAETHGGPVYLQGLFRDFKGDRSKINLTNANFSKAYLWNTDFFSNKAYFDSIRSTALPKAPQGYEFVIDERVDENGKPIYPKNNSEYRFIKLVKI